MWMQRMTMAAGALALVAMAGPTLADDGSTKPVPAASKHVAPEVRSILGDDLAERIATADVVEVYRIGPSAEDVEAWIAGHAVIEAKPLSAMDAEGLREILLSPDTVQKSLSGKTEAPVLYRHALRFKKGAEVATILVHLDPQGETGRLLWDEGARRIEIRQADLQTFLRKAFPKG